MLKTWLAALPLIASRRLPNPSISRFCVTASGPVDSTMVCPASAASKAIVAPLLAAASAARKDPGPASAALVTVSVLRSARSSSGSKRRRVLRAHQRRFGMRSVGVKRSLAGFSQNNQCIDDMMDSKDEDVTQEATRCQTDKRPTRLLGPFPYASLRG